MSRPVPAKDRKSHASTTPTIHRSSLPLPVPDTPSTLGPIGASCWTNVWTLGAGVYQPTDVNVIERYCALHERRHRLLVIVEADGWLSTGSTGQVVVHPAARMVSDILDLATVDYPDESTPDDRDIDLGFVSLTSVSGLTSNALDYLQKISRSENGRFLVNHAGAPSATNFGGILQFYARNAETDDMGITISDAKTLPTGSVEAAQLSLEYGSETLFNSFQWTDSAAGVQTGSNAASIAKYGERVSKKTLLSNAATTDESGDWFIGLFDEPQLRVSQAVVDIDSATTADAEKLLHLHVNSAVDLSYLPPGSSVTLAGAYIIEGVGLDITVRDMATGSARIRATYSTSAADIGYWVLDDPALSVFPTLLAPSWLDTSTWRLDDPDRDVLPTQLG